MSDKYANPALGYVSILLCCLTSAISFVFISHLNKTHSQMLSIFITFGYAIILFNLFNVKNIINLYTSVAKNIKLVFRMNLVTLLNWISSFLSLNDIDPATAICINLCVLSITIFFILTPFKKIKENKHLVFSMLFILISMLLIIRQRMDFSSSIDMYAVAAGVAWSVIGGVSGAYIGLHSEGLGKAGFSVTQILATRFYLLTIVSGLAFLLTANATPIKIDWNYYFISTLVIVIFPLLMYQTAIKTLGALIVSLLEPFTPVITYFLQVGVGDYKFNFFTVILLIASSCAVIWFVRIEQNIARTRKLAEVEVYGAVN